MLHSDIAFNLSKFLQDKDIYQLIKVSTTNKIIWEHDDIWNMLIYKKQKNHKIKR